MYCINSHIHRNFSNKRTQSSNGNMIAFYNNVLWKYKSNPCKCSGLQQD